MDRDTFIAMLEKLPKGTDVLVRGGPDDAWEPTIKVFTYQGQLIAVVKIDCVKTQHYNYPPGKPWEIIEGD